MLGLAATARLWNFIVHLGPAEQHQYGRKDDTETENIRESHHGWSAFVLGLLLGSACFTLVVLGKYRHKYRQVHRIKISSILNSIPHSSQQELESTLSDGHQDQQHGTQRPDGSGEGLEADTEPLNYETALAQQFWPYLSALITKIGNEMLPPLLRDSKPLWMGGIKLHKFCMGSKGPELRNIKIQPAVKGRVAGEADFVWRGNQELVLSVRPIPRKLGIATVLLHLVSGIVRLEVGVHDLEMRGRARASILLDLQGKPRLGGMQLAFVEQPQFSFDVQLYGGDLNMLPGLEEWLTTFVRGTLLKPFILPEVLDLPVMDGRRPRVDPERPLMQPQGLLIVRLLSAHDLPKTDWLSDTDAYVKFRVREGAELQSRAIHNTREPRWADEEFAFLVHEPRHQHLHVTTMDVDKIGRDEHVGWASVPIKQLGRGQTRRLELKLASPAKDASGARQKVHLETTALRVRALKARVKDAVRRGPAHLVLEATYLELNSEELNAARCNPECTTGHQSQAQCQAGTSGGDCSASAHDAADMDSSAQHTNPADSLPSGGSDADATSPAQHTMAAHSDSMHSRQALHAEQQAPADAHEQLSAEAARYSSEAARGQEPGSVEASPGRADTQAEESAGSGLKATLREFLGKPGGESGNPRHAARDLGRAARQKGGAKAIFEGVREFVRPKGKLHMQGEHPLAQGGGSSRHVADSPKTGSSPGSVRTSLDSRGSSKRIGEVVQQLGSPDGSQTRRSDAQHAAGDCPSHQQDVSPARAETSNTDGTPANGALADDSGVSSEARSLNAGGDAKPAHAGNPLHTGRSRQLHDSAQSQPDRGNATAPASPPSASAQEEGLPGENDNATDGREKDRPHVDTTASQQHAQSGPAESHQEELSRSDQEESIPGGARQDAERQEQTGDRGRQLTHWLEGGIVYVQVIRAKGLKTRSFNIFGLSILMQAVVEFAGHRYKSKVLQSLDPEFRDVFEFLVDREQAQDSNATLLCELRDIRGVDDVKGQVEISLQEIRHRKRWKEVFPLHSKRVKHKPRKSFAGHVELELKWVDFWESG